MSVSAQYGSTLRVTETLPDALLSSTGNKVLHNGLDSEETFNATTTVPATTVSSFNKTMSSGAATIDLRALTGVNGAAIDGNGLKVQCAKFRNKTTNANNITIVGGASNGFLIFGTAGTITLPPGGEILLYLKDQSSDIDATHKTIDISGTGSQVLECLIVMG